MRYLPNLARPDFAFCIPWLLVLAAYLPVTTPITPAINPAVAMMLAFNIVSAPFILYVIERSVKKHLKVAEIDRPVLDAPDIRILHRFLGAMMMIWGATFLASVVYSGGLPLVWSITGNDKSYSDFGIPTVGGLSVLLRSVCATLCIVLFLATRKKLYLLCWLILFLDCVSEVSRSALFMFSCQSLAAFLLLQKVKLRHLLLSLVVLAGLLGMFVFLGSLRGIQMDASDFQIAAFGSLPPGVYWAWAYLVSPLGNVSYATTLGITPLYFPANTFGALFPSVIGSAVGLRATHYPIQLVSDSLNATSMYAPLIADFGVSGATFLMAMFQAIASYAYVMARRGSFLFIIVYPALFGCLVLSIFFIYAGSLQIILVPAMALWARRFYRRRRPAAAIGVPNEAAHNAVQWQGKVR